MFSTWYKNVIFTFTGEKNEKTLSIQSRFIIAFRDDVAFFTIFDSNPPVSDRQTSIVLPPHRSMIRLSEANVCFDRDK